ncbi:MAG: hypothetical protein ACOYLQ_00980 [Hyphomicrobiaceae bacterium]
MTDDKPKPAHQTFLAAPPRVINIGLARFAEDLAGAGASVVHVAWAPPAGGDVAMAKLLAKLGS